MSNLKFKSPTHPVALRKFLKSSYPHALCESTVVRFHPESDPISGYSPVGGLYSVWYHGSAIAWIADYAVEISNAGYGTHTTRTRLNMVLRDNSIPARVGQKDFVQTMAFDGKVYKNFRWARFAMIAGQWELTDGQYDD